MYSLVEVASLQGELNAANRTSEGAQSTQQCYFLYLPDSFRPFGCLCTEINRMAQSQLVEAAQAMRKMKQHVEQLAKTKRHYESTIKDMSEKLTRAEKANLELRNRKPESTASDQTNSDDLEASRREVCTLQASGCSYTVLVFYALASAFVLPIPLRCR